MTAIWTQAALVFALALLATLSAADPAPANEASQKLVAEAPRKEEKHGHR